MYRNLYHFYKDPIDKDFLDNHEYSIMENAIKDAIRNSNKHKNAYFYKKTINHECYDLNKRDFRDIISLFKYV